MTDKIAFVTYETPFAPCGGIAAVMGRLPGYVQTASGLPVIVISPFHHRIGRMASLSVADAGSLTVPFNGSEVKVSVCRHDDQWPWHFLLPEDKQFFAGIHHPYDVGQTATNLLRDALFFGAAVSRALDLIDPEARWILMMQDWEAATTALALARRRKNCKLFLTLHNSYDSGAAQADLASVKIDPGACPGDTVLQRALPLVEKPVFTVSEQFALDLTEDILQTVIKAPHLQEMLKSKLVGVDNGLFANLAVPQDILTEATQGNFASLRKWKHDQKNKALQALDRFTPSEDRPLWGDLARLNRDDAPWFVMAGRDDPSQKGYDVAACAIDRFLEQGGQARFMFFPIPGDEGLAGLDFMKKLSQKFPDSVLALPFLFKEGFVAALQGAAYGMMPSLYEPFGMANEFYMNGTVGIGRATGGIVQQIVPLRGWGIVRSYCLSVHQRASRWHDASAQPTGILYREKDDIESAVEDWRGINAAQYAKGGASPDRVQERQRYRLFRAMADELHLAILDGVQVYRNKNNLYYKLLVAGINHIQHNFSWERSAGKYVRNLGIAQTEYTTPSPLSAGDIP